MQFTGCNWLEVKRIPLEEQAEIICRLEVEHEVAEDTAWRVERDKRIAERDAAQG